MSYGAHPDCGISPPQRPWTDNASELDEDYDLQLYVVDVGVVTGMHGYYLERYMFSWAYFGLSSLKTYAAVLMAFCKANISSARAYQSAPAVGEVRSLTSANRSTCIPPGMDLLSEIISSTSYTL